MNSSARARLAAAGLILLALMLSRVCLRQGASVRGGGVIGPGIKPRARLDVIQSQPAFVRESADPVYPDTQASPRLSTATP